MTFLPIVDRELREGSRRRGTYWLRVRVAFQALLIGVVAYFINFLQPQLKLGTALFWGLSGVSLLFGLLAGRRSTADCLSQEKREGTLGLLFLTDLKGYDVVLGKLVATSISGFYALVSIFPVLAIPLLAGGMTNGELWRMVLVLINTFFFSLSIGILASAVSREYRTAMAVNFFLALVIIGAPVACAMWFETMRNRFVPQLYYSCPIFSFFMCNDINYASKGMARNFWWSLAFTHGLAWMLTLSACWIVPRTWGDKPAPAPSRRWRWRNLGRMISYGSQARCAAFRQRTLDVNAFYWLAARARLKPAHVWFFLGCAVVWWVLGCLKWGNYWMADATFFTTAIIINSALKLWITVEARQRLGEERRAGAFELLLATPLTVGDFLRGQILALRRQFLGPLLLVTALELVLTLALKRHGTINAQDVWTCLAGICMLWADVVALPWVAMAAALTRKSQTQANSYTVARIFILPWVMFGCVMAGLNLLDDLDLMHWHPSERFTLGLWFGIGLATDLLFGLRAWHLLRRNFRRLAVQTFLAEPPHAPRWRSFWNAIKWTGRLPARCVPARARKPVFACLGVGVALVAVLLVRRSQQHFAPPVLVSLTQSNAPFNIFPGGDNGVFFIMPDGTLWQWGRPGAPQSPRSEAPEQIGIAHDWVKAVGAGTHCLGLRADGTIWSWGFSNGRYNPEPQPAIAGHDWIDVGTGSHHAAGVKRDGTLWTWNEPLVANGGKAEPRPDLAPGVAGPGAPRIGSSFHHGTRAPSSNWVSVCCGAESTFALQKDGTLWVEGFRPRFVGNNWVNIYADPGLLCTNSNWTALDANGLTRNRDGELWDSRQAPSEPNAGASEVCYLVSTNVALDRVHSVAPWTLAQIRANGTLWTLHLVPSHPPLVWEDDWSRIGTRSDWVGVWGEGRTSFGMTADGTVWTWGVELGQEPLTTYESRWQLLRDHLTGGPSHTSTRSSPLYSPQPRPLLKLAGLKANLQQK
jgi:alpha-tubulin suppressor-like RCC1 family protein/ABC-type transport system involved in multi-copper enzyme maturation permease subunit